MKHLGGEPAALEAERVAGVWTALAEELDRYLGLDDETGLW